MVDDNSISSQTRFLVGISGVPASGKSTVAQLVTDYVNAKLSESTPVEDSNSTSNPRKDVAVLIGLDGWHLTRAQLDALPDPKLAHDRRGAHWTFDGEAYVAFIHSLRHDASAEAIWAPSFSHELKDPTPGAVAVHPWHRLVVIEGLYTFLGITPWQVAAEMLDERWWLEIGDDDAEARLVARHVKSGVAKDFAEAMWRSKENDMPSKWSDISAVRPVTFS